MGCGQKTQPGWNTDIIAVQKEYEVQDMYICHQAL